jgi:hypothetical protein
MQDSIREIAVDIVCADGRRLPALVNFVLKRDAAGAPLLIRTTVFDASDRRRYEEELLAARDRARTERERTQRLQKLSGALAAAADTGAVAHAVGEELVSTFGADRTGFAVRDPDGQLRPVFLRGGGRVPAPGAGAAFDEGGERSGALARLRVGATHASGVMWMGFDEPRAFTPEERELLIACARQATVALDRARLFEEQRDVAQVLQQSMRVIAPPDDPRFGVATHFAPADEHLEVGGDWYDTFGVPGAASRS